MKTRTSEQQPGHGLPPPPAPTARDANPWPMSSGAGAKRHEPRHPRAPGWPPQPRASQPGTAGRRPATPWIPLLILFFVLGTGLQVAIRALAEGDVETAIGALVVCAAVAVVAVGRIFRRRTR
jgi:hypothetical protein